MINHPYVKLTARQQEILRLMAETEDPMDAEIVCDGIHCYIGTERISFKTVRVLLMYVLISGWETDRHSVQYLHINESGRRYLAGERMLYSVSNKSGELELVDKPLIVPWF